MSKISDFIDILDLPVDATYRCDCPVCHGRNTFTVTNDKGNVLYNCYKNSCKIAGAHHKNLDAFTIKAMLTHGSASESYSEQALCRYDVPPYIVPYTEVDNPIDPMFLHRYDIDPEDVFYDIRQDRLVFLVLSEELEVVDAVGRSLTKRQPKWLRYASSPVPYVHGCGWIGVVVEDAISAYVIGEKFPKLVGIALLGTQLTNFHKSYLAQHWDSLYIALDPDARDKTLKITKELSAYVPNVRALNITDDLKYMKDNDVITLENIA